MVKATNPGGRPIEVFDGIRSAVASGRSRFWKELSLPFYDFNRPDAHVSEGLRDSFWLQGMLMSIKGAYDYVAAFSEDFGGDLAKLDVPTLVMHGNADQIIPFADSDALTSKLVKGAQLKLYTGAPHGLCQTIWTTWTARRTLAYGSTVYTPSVSHGNTLLSMAPNLVRYPLKSLLLSIKPECGGGLLSLRRSYLPQCAFQASQRSWAGG
jgi:Serine aminopeptidase, S33